MKFNNDCDDNNELIPGLLIVEKNCYLACFFNSIEKLFLVILLFKVVCFSLNMKKYAIKKRKHFIKKELAKNYFSIAFIVFSSSWVNE